MLEGVIVSISKYFMIAILSTDKNGIVIKTNSVCIKIAEVFSMYFNSTQFAF